MNRKFNPIVVVGTLLLLVGVAALAVLAARDSGASATEKVKALVASSDIAQGTAADAAGLRVQEVAARDVPAGSPTDVGALTGKVASTKILKGQVITASSFGIVGASTSAGVSLPK